VHYRSNKHAVFYFSKAITNIEYFIEFFYEIINERVEPLILVFEGINMVLRLREYVQLVKREHLNSYIDLDAYEDWKKLKEIKENHFFLVRSKKRLPKIKNFK
jgi:hypothetical protein